MNPNRGSFPRSPTPETPDDKRLRFEDWMINTAAGDTPDPELAAILAQPNRDPAVTSHSLERIVRARCWQCVAGNDDDGARERIEQCGVSTCSLHPIRPYRTATEEAAAEAGAKMHRRKRVHAHCRDCQGGDRTPHVTRAATACTVVSCALWPARPQIKDAPPNPPAEPETAATAKPATDPQA